jgi:hypothetical protein
VDDFEVKITHIANGFQGARVLLLGVELGLFDRLAQGPTTAAQLAADLELQERGVEITCDALTAMELLGKDGDRYYNRAETNRYLVRGSPDSNAFIMGHRVEMFGSWSRLDKTIRTGLQQREYDQPTLSDAEVNRNFILGMAEVSRERLGAILDALPLAGTRRFIDLGGGPAHYACEAVRRHEGLSALLVDLPLTIEVAREFIAGEGLQDRVETQVCNFYLQESFELGEPADVMLISQVLHAEGEAENRALLRKVHPNVRDGGTVAIVENLVDPGRVSPLPGAMFAVNMLASTARGRTFTAAEISEWLVDAGFDPTPVVDIAPRTSLILATKI